MVINIKKIGIILRKIEENNKKFVGIRLDMLQAFKEFDVITIGIPITNDFKVIKKDGKWTVENVSTEDLEKIHGIYNYSND